MKCINLTNFEKINSNTSFEYLYRVDDIYLSSIINNSDQLKFLKHLEVKSAIHITRENHLNSENEQFFSHYEIKYHPFQFNDLNDLNFDKLQKFQHLLCQNHGKKLIYSPKGWDAATLLTLSSCFICGHCKRNCLELSKKLDIQDSESLAFLDKKLAPRTRDNNDLNSCLRKK